MLKQSHNNMHLYDKVRQDLFEETQQTNLRTPSITTICLLQIQAYVVQILSTLPPIRDTRTSSPFQRVFMTIRSVIRNALRWILLIMLLLLDNIARLLNVEREMAGVIAPSPRRMEYRQVEVEQKQHQSQSQNQNQMRGMLRSDDEEDNYRSSTDTYRDDYDLPNKTKTDQCTKGNSSTNHHGGISEPSSPNKRSSGHYYSPMNSPTPHIFIQPSRKMDFSPVLGPSRVTRNRASSFNTTEKPKLLRRSPGQREITVQNATLPILPKKKKHAPPNSIVSRSSSESSTGRPRMQKTMSLSTAQQYQHNNECPLPSLRQTVDTKRPYERYCPACTSHS
ncbi:uncharacterized protein EV154DRAFT_493569 [Mucor mucedo]|uniref:uncharacterized protein n=1 Tax=Mucor mucedo TaxID=29922 RepID=UPI00221FEA47|nr:uncharacterized protein EV154DRAFT_493569 [Mucor mucedo]KAI7896124.1 hypothetical protein EV154DRAFT_493569 [Mucor mucedo]